MNAFLVGAMKAGTTTLFDRLAAHPKIAAATPKEPRFYDGPMGHDERIRYDACFGDGRRLDGSPQYLHHPDAAARIAADDPDARILVLLREPVSRAWSHYHHVQRHRPTMPPFSDFVERAERQGVRHVGYLKQSLYADGLRRFTDRFAVWADETANLRGDADAVVASAAAFLGLDPPPPVVGDANVLRRPRNRIGRHVLRNERLAAVVKRTVPRAAWQAAGRLLWSEHRPKLDGEVAERAAALFVDDVQETERLLGRRLPSLHRRS